MATSEESEAAQRARTIAQLRKLIAAAPAGSSGPVAAPTVGASLSGPPLSAPGAAEPSPGAPRSDGARSQEAPPAPSAHGTPPASEFEQARQVALRRLTVRARSGQELRQDLIRRQVSPQVAEAVVARFTEVGLIDDAAFARQWVADRRAAKSLSAARLRRELSQKGVASPTIDQVLGEISDSETDLAEDLARRRLRTMTGLSHDAVVRRLTSQLGRRGFPPSVVRRAVIAVLDEVPGGDDLGNIVGDE